MSLFLHRISVIFVSKCKLGCASFKIKEILKIGQYAFLLLFIRCWAFFWKTWYVGKFENCSTTTPKMLQTIAIRIELHNEGLKLKAWQQAAEKLVSSLKSPCPALLIEEFCERLVTL